MSRTKTISFTVTFLALFCVFGGEQPPAEDFPIAELQYADGSRLFHLNSGYGFIAKWETDGKPSFFLYDKPRANISTTRDLKIFLDGLSSFPDGSKVAWVNTCGAPLHYGMPVGMLSVIERVLEKKRFRMAGIAENNFVLCTCEATNLIYFASTVDVKESTNRRRAGSSGEAVRSETNRTPSTADSYR